MNIHGHKTALGAMGTRLAPCLKRERFAASVRKKPSRKGYRYATKSKQDKRIFNRDVTGSTPVFCTLAELAQSVEHLTCKDSRSLNWVTPNARTIKGEQPNDRL